MNLRRLQNLSVVSAAVFLGLAVLTILLGFQVVPRGVPGLVWGLHAVLAIVGLLGGVAAVHRRAEINAERWRIVDGDDLTTGERDHAHREAESRLRTARFQFLLGGVAPGGWLAYQLRPARADAGAAVNRVLGGQAEGSPPPSAAQEGSRPVESLVEALAAEQTYTLSASDVLILTPLIAFGLGMLWARWRGDQASGAA